MGREISANIAGFFRSLGNPLEGLANWIGNLPGMQQVKSVAGTMVSIGRNAVSAVSGCFQAVWPTLKIAGALALGAGAIYLLSKAGLLGGIATMIGMGVLARFFIGRTIKLWRFNWNITDDEIKNRYKAKINALAGQAGSLVGSGLAHLACAKGGGIAVVCVNPLAGALVKEVQKDTWEEVEGNARSLIQTAGAAFEEWLVLETYRNVRTLIKKSVSNQRIRRFLPQSMKSAIDHWGSKGSKPWSFASAVEEKIENINSQWLRNFVEETREEFAEVCTQATYALTYGL